MADVMRVNAVKIKLSPVDKSALRRLIVDEIEWYKKEGLSSEELIARISGEAVRFMESCIIEIE
jgi:hypothetical protein